LCRQLPVFGRLAYPVRAEVTKHVLPGSKSLGCPAADLGDEQTWRPEHKEISAAPKSCLVESRVREKLRKPTRFLLGGRPMPQRKKQVKALCGTAGVWDQASKERFTEITSGRTRWQQGLGATCQDSSNEAKNRRRGEPGGFGA
jgi:hypothetical protein